MRRGPERLPPLWWLRSGVYYLHVGLATVVLGIWGLPKALISGREGAQRVATVWIGYMLRAARWHRGVAVELRGTPPARGTDALIAWSDARDKDQPGVGDIYVALLKGADASFLAPSAQFF